LFWNSLWERYYFRLDLFYAVRRDENRDENVVNDNVDRDRDLYDCESKIPPEQRVLKHEAFKSRLSSQGYR
jgi:hypothetical protein